MNYSALIYAFEQRDIAITGTGTLDGLAGAEHWWPWKGTKGAPAGATQAEGRAKLIDMGARGVPVAERVFGDGSNLRPHFIQAYRCQNVVIAGVTIGSLWAGSVAWLNHFDQARGETTEMTKENALYSRMNARLA